MRKCILIFSILIFIISCKESIPSAIIKPEKMQDVLWDVLRADALAQQLVRINSSKSLPTENIKLTRKAFLIHNITEEEFQKSYSYYTRHPELMKTILDSLNARKTRIPTIEMPLKKTRLILDSPKQKI